MQRYTVDSSTLGKIREGKPTFRESEQKVAEYVLAHPREVVNLPITELAERIGVSEATIVRMCKQIGFRGFQELKINMALEIVNPLQALHEEIQEGDDAGTILKKVVQANVKALDTTANVLSIGELKRAIGALFEAKRIYFYGLGGSAPIAMDGAHKFTKTGKPVIAYNDPHMQAVAAVLLGPGDVVVGISHSGSNRDIIEALEVAKSQGATTIGITHYARSPIDRVLDIKLGVYSSETLYRIESASSRIAQLTIIDALFVGVCLCEPEKAINNIKVTREVIVPKRF